MSIDFGSIKAWPYEEALKLQAALGNKLPEKGYVLFETGYGPSGLPHLGTFGEVLRTTMVRRAFEEITGFKTRLFTVSDDMDGLRKVPDNVPNKDLLAKDLEKPLTQVMDPFGTHPSFGEHNNNRLRDFLDSYNFEYEFVSATECYKSGRFDDCLKRVFEHYDEIMAVMLPTLGEERQQTYSPFLPVCPRTGKVLQVRMEELKKDSYTVVYKDPETHELVEQSILGGNCKLQWKVDWGMRWVAFGVDYEMYGKDLISSYELSSKIAKIIGGKVPTTLNYEHFLDEKGQKISKSKGNGLSMEDWLKYAPQESLAYYMYQQPRRAKRLFFDVIPKNVDEYTTFLGKYEQQNEMERRANPVYHIHGGNPPAFVEAPSFSMLLNLVSICHTEDKAVLWDFLKRYDSSLTPERAPLLDRLLNYALQYYNDFVKPAKKFRAPTAEERVAMQDLVTELEKLEAGANEKDIQTVVYEVGKKYYPEALKDWFQVLYQTLLGQAEGPRMGSFFALYGLKKSIDLIKNTIK